VFEALAGSGQRYDLILSNPPYVTQAAVDELPEEYRHEPAMSLGAGISGLAATAWILCGVSLPEHASI
jgi:ribosomal protein L3 glutamine methyltransferase